MGSNGVPAVKEMTASQFRSFLSGSQIALGAALLTPFIPGWVAGAGLAGFSSALLAMYAKTPGMTKEDGVRPTEDGVSIAKDVVMLGTGITLVLDDLINRNK